MRIQPVARVFIGMGMVHFLAGAILGALMTNHLAWANLLTPYHAELNPFGWLTFLIYGMTYAVLQLFASLRVPWPVLPWLHFASAEAGLIAILLGNGTALTGILDVGWSLQALAALLFMAAVLSAVVDAHKPRRVAESFAPSAAELLSLPSSFAGFRLGRQDVIWRQTDRVAERGTSMALVLFVGVAVVACIQAIRYGGTPWLSSTRIQILLYDGWLAGTVLAVSLHLLPRYERVRPLQKTQVSIIQWLWFVGVLCAGFANPEGWLHHWALRAIGLSFTWLAALYLRELPRMPKEVPVVSRVAWWMAWLFAFILGVLQVLGVDPLSLPSLHLLFLGWVTTLVYGIGYTFFPLILNRRPAPAPWALGQVSVSGLGAVMLIIGMIGIGQQSTATWALPWLASGGTCATLGFIAFIGQWLIRG
ncbi:hypothetical protein [Sulfoacidibacillus ferrooxidans]|uniref:NnrS family protein n=1 Tax=Sulfoacidibacillus ferrooxidans TaxID=2005001 RepID=A0A9X2AD49_9BACL|nr:hypothetical protein [Sulfoacidibacillus ferrooxidans]MCI0184494.1 hypothetical protein [Sulfoacidibacillus ferrooxidans]